MPRLPRSIDDLQSLGRLDRTLIVVATEFGRPAGFDARGGRGHQSTTFSMVLAGGGLNHQGAVGVTDELSKSIVDSPVSVADFHATVHHAMQIDPAEYSIRWRAAGSDHRWRSSHRKTVWLGRFGRFGFSFGGNRRTRTDHESD